MNDESILKFYGDDHDRLDHLFGEFRRLKPQNLREAASRFTEFKVGLERHIRWEEEILFPAFEEETGMRNTGPTVVMRQEHAQIKQKLGAIAAKLGAGDTQTDAEEAGLHEILGTHNWKEENVLYPAIDHQVSPEDRSDIYARMAAIEGNAGHTPVSRA